MDHELLGEAQERPDTQLPCQCLAEPGLPAFHSPAPNLRERKNVMPYERGLSKVYLRTHIPYRSSTDCVGWDAYALGPEQKWFNHSEDLSSELCPFYSRPFPLSPSDHQTLPAGSSSDRDNNVNKWRPREVALVRVLGWIGSDVPTSHSPHAQMLQYHGTLGKVTDQDLRQRFGTRLLGLDLSHIEY